MTDSSFSLAPEQWERLASARQAYTNTVSPQKPLLFRI